METNQLPHVVIIGAGTAGIMLANKLKNHPVQVSVVDPSEEHYYQPGFLFVPFGIYHTDALKKPTSTLLRNHVRHIKEVVSSIEAEKHYLTTESGMTIPYDVLVIATGAHIDPAQTEGLLGEGWRKNIFDFYTPEGAIALNHALANFHQGHLVVQIMDMPIKCPVAPLEFAFMADDYFSRKGNRSDIQISLVTPLSGAFTKPIASEKLGHLLTDKQIDVVTDFYVERVVANENKLVCFDGREVNYDLLVTIPVNVGSYFLRDSGLTNELGFVEVNHQSLQSTTHQNIFAIGDAADLPTSKAGSVAHFEVDTIVENISRLLAGQPMEESFDGHSNCFVEAGNGKALLLDFNYDVEPLEGTFPFARFGPMKLLQPTRINYIGKQLFRYVYWYMLLPGRNIPFIPTRMSMKGKRTPHTSETLTGKGE